MSKEKQLTKLKIADFKSSADKVLKKNYRARNYLTRFQIADIVVSGPAPRFYTTVDTAMRRMNQILSGTLTITNPLQVEMFKEITKRYLEKLKEYGNKKYTVDIMYEVITEPAPKFYMTSKSAYVYLYKKEK